MRFNQLWLRATFGISSPVQLWWGIDPVSAGLFSVPVTPVGFAVILLVSLVVKPPNQDIQALVDFLRYPDLNFHDRSFAAPSGSQNRVAPEQVRDGL